MLLKLKNINLVDFYIFKNISYNFLIYLSKNLVYNKD